ncbi:M23 family metallopeptidase [Crocosphaera sp.]|uniref:M23 family metallopeptidase n=1 Tax=Crocosphaera sp. TaxID=2729996 RepID=UPI003F277D00|nr:M23 family metallopeptidase [Crocosphaera sp.]
MKLLSNRLIIAGVSVCFSLACHSMVVASGESETGTKLRPLPSDRYLPQTPVSPRGYIWPSQGNLTSGFGMRFERLHTGVDIAAPIGTPILAAASGVVVFAGWSNKGLGYQVSIRHPDGNVSVYGHNQRLLVTSGQTVEQGQQIAEMGSTGFSTGPHLHFEIRPGGRKAVNPMAFLPGQKPTLTPEQAELIRRR